MKDPLEDVTITETRRGSVGVLAVLIALAGVSVNVVLAFVLIYASVVGPGRVYEGPSTSIASVVTNSAAEDAGLRAGDRIVAVDGVRIANWDALKRAIERRGGQSTAF